MYEKDGETSACRGFRTSAGSRSKNQMFTQAWALPCPSSARARGSSPRSWPSYSFGSTTLEFYLTATTPSGIRSGWWRRLPISSSPRTFKRSTASISRLPSSGTSLDSTQHDCTTSTYPQTLTKYWRFALRVILLAQVRFLPRKNRPGGNNNITPKPVGSDFG